MNINNAVILAAGYSSRFVPLAFDVPKGLLVVKGETLIERQIRQLKEVGVNDITIVTGAYAEQFDFLKEKHKVNLVFNPDYKSKNNFASLFAARQVLGNTIISSSDLFFTKNIFQNKCEHPYFVATFSRGKTMQRALCLDKKDKIIATRYGGANTWITFGGHAVLSEKISNLLIKYMSPVYDNPDYSNKYWVDFQDAHISEMPMYIKRLKVGDIVEFNTLAALQDFDPTFIAEKQSPTLSRIMKELGETNERLLQNFEPIKQGNTAVGCWFEYKKQKYEYINGNMRTL